MTAPVTNGTAPAAAAVSPDTEVSKLKPHRIVVVGGAYSGIAAVLGLLDGADGKPVGPYAATAEGPGTVPQRGVEVTLIDERDGFFHSVGAPLAHVAKESVHHSWIPHRTIKRLNRKDVIIRHGSIKRVAPEARTLTFADFDNDDKDAQVDYDYLILATGMKRDWPIVPRAAGFKDYVLDANTHIAGIETANGSTVAVVGGGAVGIEFSAEMKNYHPHNRVILIHSRQELLSNEPLPQEFKERAAAVLEEEGVEVILGQRATQVNGDDGSIKITLSDGREIEVGSVFMATSRFTPNTSYLPQDAVDDEGYVLVNEKMAFASGLPNEDRHYAVGDIVHWSGIKRAGPAMVMGRVAATNVFNAILKDEDAAFEGTPATFPEVPPMMGLAVGKQAITYHPDHGVRWGKDKLTEVFGHDLGWSSTLNFLQLSDHVPVVKTTA